MEYRFLDQPDDALIGQSELPVEGGIAFAVRSTGYDLEDDEVLELAVVDLSGAELFHKLVKPQNKDDWKPSDASGGIAPADVADAPELYTFEEEVDGLFENAAFVVAAHLDFAESMVEASWVTLPDYEGFDLVARFLETHASSDRPGEPAPVASLPGIAGYYGVDFPPAATDEPTLVAEARAVAACYRAYVAEFAEQRRAKGEAHWQRYEEAHAEEFEAQRAREATARLREHRLNQMNGLLWFAGAIIFVSLVIQTYQGGGDMGLMVVFGAVAVFAFVRGVVNFRK